MGRFDFHRDGPFSNPHFDSRDATTDLGLTSSLPPQVKKDYEKTYGEIGKLYDREDELLLEEECLMNEYSDVQEEIEQKELRREALLKNMNHMCEELLYEKYR